MDKKKKDLELLGLLCLTAVAGLINILLNGNMEVIPTYLICMCVIPILYFNYSLCKWENQWSNRWREKNPGTGEPTVWLLKTTKIGEWIIFIVGMAFALIPKL